MRVSINLATRPYVELDRLLRQLRIAIGSLAVLALALGLWLQSLSARAREQQAQLDSLNAQADRLQRERAANEARLRQPVNAATLNRNQFLNLLFTRKSFSWTAVLMDLEDVLPAGVQVSSIEPIISTSGDVTIRMRVLGERERTVDLVRNLEKSRRFIAPRLAGEAQQTANRNSTTIGANGLPQLAIANGANGLSPISGVEFEIVSGYKPAAATRAGAGCAAHGPRVTRRNGGGTVRLPSGITVPGVTTNEATRERMRKLAGPLNLHIAAVAVLGLLCVYLAVRLFLVSGNTGTQGDEAIVVAQSRVAAADVAARPLRGVDTKLQASDAEAAEFYQTRLPYAYSDVAGAIGTLAKTNGVRWSRASYVQALPADGVTELRIDGSVAGDYTSVARFINAVERSRSFFVIENLALSGAQGGLVNLQLRIGTYIREPMPLYATTPASTGAQQ